jgi:hypothetical protein
VDDLIRLHFVVPDFEFESYKTPVDTRDQVGRAFSGTP